VYIIWDHKFLMKLNSFYYISFSQKNHSNNLWFKKCLKRKLTYLKLFKSKRHLYKENERCSFFHSSTNSVNIKQYEFFVKQKRKERIKGGKLLKLSLKSSIRGTIYLERDNDKWDKKSHIKNPSHYQISPFTESFLRVPSRSVSVSA